MSIKYLPSKLLKKIAPEAKIKKLLGSNLSLKKTALSFVDDIDFIDKKDVVDVALNVISSYKDRVKREVEDGAKASVIKDEIAGDAALLINRVQNELVLQIKEGIKENYDGESYIWLPSDAEEPDAEHQLNYGKKFLVGDGEMPGDRYGCRCGMEILVEGSQLDLTNGG